MEEDFLYINDGEDERVIDLQHQPPNQTIEIPKYNISADKNIVTLDKLQMLQDEQKSGVFESTEATIYRNRRAHVKKIRPHNFNTGDSVLFRNPETHGLSSTLNVIGTVGDKIGRNLYRVEHDNHNIVLFGSEMVPYTPSSIENVQYANTLFTLEPHLVLDRIGM